MVVYIDVLFMINFIMDYIVLWSVNKISKNNTSFKRLLLGSFLGALLLCLMLFLPVYKPIYNVIGFLFLSLILVVVTFKVKTVKDFIKLFLLIHIVSFTIGGTGIAIFYYTSLGSTITNLVTYQLNNISVKVLIFSVIISYIMIKVFINWYGKFVLSKRKLYNLSIIFEDKMVSTNGLVDTGNTLVDPFTNMPVVIVESEQLKDMLPKNLVSIIGDKDISDLNSLTNITYSTSLGKRLRLIPFTSLGQENGLLIGFRPDSVQLNYSNTKNKDIDDVIIGISYKKLTKDDSYHALIHPALID